MQINSRYAQLKRDLYLSYATIATKDHSIDRYEHNRAVHDESRPLYIEITSGLEDFEITEDNSL